MSNVIHKFKAGDRVVLLRDYFDVPKGTVVTLEDGVNTFWFSYLGEDYPLACSYHPIEDTIALERDVAPFRALKGKVIILNAPKGAGKDVTAEAICTLTGASQAQFKEHLYVCGAALFNLPLEEYIEMCTNRETKDKHSDKLKVYPPNMAEVLKLDLQGSIFNWKVILLSPRDSLIYVSECVIKPTFGGSYFGDKAAENLDLVNGTVFSDGGFVEEIIPVVEKAGADNVLIAQFTRKGHENFDGDSRDWVGIPGVRRVSLKNDGTIEEMRDKVLEAFGVVVQSEEGEPAKDTGNFGYWGFAHDNGLVTCIDTPMWKRAVEKYYPLFASLMWRERPDEDVKLVSEGEAAIQQLVRNVEESRHAK